jgi:TonB family protein
MCRRKEARLKTDGRGRGKVDEERGGYLVLERIMLQLDHFIAKVELGLAGSMLHARDMAFRDHRWGGRYREWPGFKEAEMLAMRRLPAIVLAVAFAAACSTRPTAEIDAAKASLDQASASAGRYAAGSLKAAQEANDALDAELAVQDAKWIKSYDRARELAESTRVASEKAMADATAGKARAEAESAAAAARAKASAESRAKLATTAVRVGGAVRNPTKTKNVAPVYPAMAKSARIGGTVQVEATIGPDGKVADARIVKSVALLDQAALDAVKQWEYEPTRVKGVPVPVIVTVAINFEP